MPSQSLIDPGPEQRDLRFGEVLIALRRHAGFVGGGDAFDDFAFGGIARDGERLAVGLAENLFAQIEAIAGFGILALMTFEAAALEEGIDVVFETDWF